MVTRPHPVALIGLVIVLCACSPTAPADPADTTRPVLHIEFFGLPAQGNETSPTEPQSYLGSMPTRVDTVLGETYQVIASLTDQESGVQYFEIKIDHPPANCWPSAVGERLDSTETTYTRISGTRPPYYLSPAWLAIDPNFAPLKGHPRFERLLKARQ